MVLDMARPKYKESTTEEMLQKIRLLRWTFYRYSRSISQRSSSSWITTRNRMVRTKVQRVGWTCERRSFLYTHSRGKENIQRTLVSYFEQNRQKWTYEASIWLQSRCHNEKLLTPRIRRTNRRAHPSRSAKTHTTRAVELINIQGGTIGFQLQVPRGGTHPNGVGSELTKFCCSNLFFVASGFVYSW